MMFWSEFRKKVYRAASRKTRKEKEGNLLGVKLKKLRDGVWLVGDTSPLAAATASSQRQAADQLAAEVLKMVKKKVRALPGSEFSATLKKIAVDL